MVRGFLVIVLVLNIGNRMFLRLPAFSYSTLDYTDVSEEGLEHHDGSLGFLVVLNV